MQCPVCQVLLSNTDPKAVNAHIDDCLTAQYLAEHSAHGPLHVPDTSAVATGDESMAALGLFEEETEPQYGSSTVDCPYPGCTTALEAYQLPSHANSQHASCTQALSCPICEHETGEQYTITEKTNLLRHLRNTHADLEQMHQALVLSRQTYLGHFDEPVELPKGVGKDCQIETLRHQMPEKECQICLDDFAKGDTVAWMDCFCVFHVKCIETWWTKSDDRVCPVHKSDD